MRIPHLRPQLSHRPSAARRLSASRRHRLLAVAVCTVLAFLTACSGSTPAPDVSVSTGASGHPLFDRPVSMPAQLGVNYHPLWAGMTDDLRPKVLEEIRESGVGWVRLDIGWANIQPSSPDSYDEAGVARIDRRIAEARAKGLRVLLLFYWAPVWASGTAEKHGRPRDPAEYAAAAAWVAQRYDGHLGEDLHVEAMELWNEPDLPEFWAQEPRDTAISDFATLVRTAGAAVKQANPAMTVVSGGLSALSVDWLREFYASDPGIGTSYDVMGLHAYPSPSDSPPSHFDPDYAQYSLLTLGRISELMTEMNDPAPIWMTEFGWSTHRNTVGTKPWARGVSEDQQAIYLLDALTLFGSTPRIQAAFWFTSFSPLGREHLDGFGFLRQDFTRKPAFFALKCAATGVCGA